MNPVENIIGPPKPNYDLCNKGHRLQLVHSDRHPNGMWDCPTCIHNQRRN